jgi:hypothetical protein
MKNRIALMRVLPVVAIFLFAVVAWARTYTLVATPVDPGATGTIDAKADKNTGNTNVTVKVEHLARPSLLTPAASEYVVWIQPQNGQPASEGVLQVGDSEKGEIKATTTASKFTVLVTAESDPHPQSPSKRVVLHANVLE